MIISNNLPTSLSSFPAKKYLTKDNLIRVYETLGPPPRLLSGHQRRAGVDGVLALAAVPGTGRLVSAGRDGRIIVWQDGQEARTDGSAEFCWGVG